MEAWLLLYLVSFLVLNVYSSTFLDSTAKVHATLEAVKHLTRKLDVIIKYRITLKNQTTN